MARFNTKTGGDATSDPLLRVAMFFTNIREEEEKNEWTAFRGSVVVPPTPVRARYWGSEVIHPLAS